jgi:hypothetical protein
MKVSALLIPLAAAALSSCVVGPDYHPPHVATPPSFSSTQMLPQSSLTEI